jgi:hypothetical protein
MHYLHLVHARDILHGGPFNISFESFQIFGLLLLLMLDDGGCLNSLLPTDLFLSTSTHLALGQDLESLLVPWGLQSSVAGSLTIDSGNTSMSPDR